MDVNEGDRRPLVYYDHAGSRIIYRVSAPTLDAETLRRQLLQDCHIRYTAKVDNYQDLLHEFDFVIGCDGRHSVVRPAADRLVDQPERDHGLGRMTMDVPLNAFRAAEHQDLAFVGQRSMISAARVNDRLRVSLVSPLLTQADADDVVHAYGRITRDWLQPVRDLIGNLDEESVISLEAIRDRDAPKLRSSIMAEANVALAGDALWSLAPYTGNAARVALDDAISIARTVSREDFKDFQPYWRRIGEAAAPIIDETRAMLTFMHNDDASARLHELQRRQQQQQAGQHEI